MSAVPAALGARHQRVQRLRRLLRRASVRQQEHAFVAEGTKLVAAALAAGVPVESVYLAAEGLAGVEQLAARAFEAGARVFELAPGLMERVADTVTPQPICAVVPMSDRRLGSVLGGTEPGRRALLVGADVRDPGNLGAVVRSAAAAGMTAVVCCDGCADVYNPKAVRASAGAVFHVDLVRNVSVAEALGELGGAGFRIFGTSAHGGTSYAETDLGGDVAIVLGNEASGLSSEVEALTHGSVTVPMADSSESLNVAMTATLLAFEVARRRAGPGGSASSFEGVGPAPVA